MGLFTYWKWPQNHCQNWFRANLLNIRLFDRYNIWGFFWPTCVGSLSPNRFWLVLNQLGKNFENWFFLFFWILRAKVAFTKKIFPPISSKRFNVSNDLQTCQKHQDLKSQRNLSHNLFFEWLNLEYTFILGYVDTPTLATQNMSCAKACVAISSPYVFDMSEDHLEH